MSLKIEVKEVVVPIGQEYTAGYYPGNGLYKFNNGTSTGLAMVWSNCVTLTFGGDVLCVEDVKPSQIESSMLVSDALKFVAIAQKPELVKDFL